MNLTIGHLDTCLPDYFRGCSTAHVQIAVESEFMLFTTIRQRLRDALGSDWVGGQDRLAQLLNNDPALPQAERDEAWDAALAAVESVRGSKKGQQGVHTGVEGIGENDETCYIYFVIEEN